MYLLDRTKQILNQDTHTLRLSYKAIVGFFPLHLRLVHKLIYLHGQSAIVFGKKINCDQLAPLPQLPAVVQQSIELIQNFTAKVIKASVMILDL